MPSGRKPKMGVRYQFRTTHTYWDSDGPDAQRMIEWFESIPSGDRAKEIEAMIEPIILGKVQPDGVEWPANLLEWLGDAEPAQWGLIILGALKSAGVIKSKAEIEEEERQKRREAARKAALNFG